MESKIQMSLILTNIKNILLGVMITHYPLAPNKIEIKGKKLFDYQLKISVNYNIPIDNFKKLLPNVSDKEKCDSLWELTTLLKTRIEANKNTSCIRVQSISMGRTINWI